MKLQRNPPLAIVGMACRLPGAPSLAEYWRLLVEGRHAIVRIPDELLESELYFDERRGELAAQNLRWANDMKDIPNFTQRIEELERVARDAIAKMTSHTGLIEEYQARHLLGIRIADNPELILALIERRRFAICEVRTEAGPAPGTQTLSVAVTSEGRNVLSLADQIDKLVDVVDVRISPRR